MSGKEQCQDGSEGPGVWTLIDHLRRIDWAGWTSLALMGAFCVTGVTLFYFPIHVDEIAMRLMNSRLLYDFPVRVGGYPTCFSSFITPLPVTLYVPALINWTLHGMVENVIALRLVGMVLAFLWTAGLAVYLDERIAKSPGKGEPALGRGRRHLYVTGWVIAVFSVGVFPFFWITNRGEQLTMPSVALLIVIFILSGQKGFQDSIWKKLEGTVLYFTAVSLILFGQSKGLFLTPFFLIVGWQLFRNLKMPFGVIAAGIVLGVQVAQAYGSIKHGMQCPESPFFEAWLRSFALDPALLFHDPRHFLGLAWQSLLKFPQYLNELGFQERTNIDYLPARSLGGAATLVNGLIKGNITVMFFAWLFFVPFQYLRKDLAKGRFVTVNLALTVLLACVLIRALFNTHKTWYDAGYVYAMLLIALVFFFGENYAAIFKRTFARWVLVYLGAVALLSQGVLQRNLPVFLKGYAGSSCISIAKYDSKKIREDLTAASNACGIDPVKSQGVVVDETSYFFFRKTKRPMAISCIGFGFGGAVNTFREFFSRVDSDGLVIRCAPVLVRYRKFMKRTGDVCCISKEDLKRL